MTHTIELYDTHAGEVIGFFDCTDADLADVVAEFSTPYTEARVLRPCRTAYLRQEVAIRAARYERLRRDGYPPITDTIFTGPSLLAALATQKADHD